MKFKIRSVEIRISFLFFAMLTMLFATDSGGIALLTILSIASHEAGHIAALLIVAGAPERIDFGIFGIRIKKSGLSYLREIAVALSGPFVNLVLFIIGILIYRTCGIYMLFAFSAVNFGIALFSLLPAVPLDGGVALSGILCATLSPLIADRIMFAISCVLSAAVIFIGAVLAIKTEANASMLFTGIYIAALSARGIEMQKRHF